MACVRLGAHLKFITPEVLKKQIFPQLNSWPELIIAALEESGLSRDMTITPMVEWLVGQGRTEAASTVAGIFPEHLDPKLKFLTQAARSANAACNHFNEPHSQLVKISEPPPVPSVEVSELNQAGLERLLDTKETKLEVRGQAYIRLLEIFSATGSMEQAV